MNTSQIRKTLILAMLLTLIGYLIFCQGWMLLSAPFAITALVLMIYSLWAASKLI